MKSCLAWLRHPDAFNYFIASELFHLNFANAEEEPIVRRILQQYYSDGIASANFENTYWYVSKDTWQYRRKEALLGEIFEKYLFPTGYQNLTKFIWLDTGGVRKLFQLSDNRKLSIAELVYNRVPEEKRILLREEVLANMQKGIFYDPVFGTHVSLCTLLNIEEAAPLIFEQIKVLGKSTERWGMARYVDSYVELKGDLSKLKPFLKAESTGEQYHFFDLADHLKIMFPKLVEKKLLELMSLPGVTDADKTSAAFRLSTMGNKAGFAFVIDKMQGSELSPTDSPERYSIIEQDTDFALMELIKIRHLILKEEDKSAFSRDARRAIIEWTYQLSQKSEKDLKKVICFFEQAQRDFAAQPNASSFTWYAEQCKEKFKDTGEYISDIVTVRSLFERATLKLAA